MPKAAILVPETKLNNYGNTDIQDRREAWILIDDNQQILSTPEDQLIFAESVDELEIALMERNPAPEGATYVVRQKGGTYDNHLKDTVILTDTRYEGKAVPGCFVVKHLHMVRDDLELAKQLTRTHGPIVFPWAHQHVNGEKTACGNGHLNIIDGDYIWDHKHSVSLFRYDPQHAKKLAQSRRRDKNKRQKVADVNEKFRNLQATLRAILKYFEEHLIPKKLAPWLEFNSRQAYNNSGFYATKDDRSAQLYQTAQAVIRCLPVLEFFEGRKKPRRQNPEWRNVLLEVFNQFSGWRNAPKPENLEPKIDRDWQKNEYPCYSPEQIKFLLMQFVLGEIKAMKLLPKPQKKTKNPATTEGTTAAQPATVG